MLDFLNLCEKHFLIFLRDIFTDPVAFSLAKSCCETLYMITFSAFFAVLFGLPLGVMLSIIKPSGIMASPLLYRILASIVNVVRSFPFIVLIFLLLPLSKMIIGTSVGSTAAIIPLVIAATPFIARLFEGVFDEVDKGLIEATMSMGASKWRVILMMISESMPSLMNAITIMAVSLLGYSAMAGVVGAGGLGDLAYRIGFQSFKPDVLAYAVVCIIILVQIIQSVGDLITKRLRAHR
ncbi:ABC transporter permease [Helicobacter jaachi]|uniref:ABC transporter permease n=1 Tax=Helicobacter jaachi TaxID=1677920 RepID=A0A4U8T9A2_9HELI|nr:methionine ABC transporter permease [Helicobacter jaachi]TLD96329.1 ABC transporter permease [Helicobacter jaachi]